MRRTAPLLLVVEGDPTAAAELTAWLYSQGFNAVIASSCLEARAVLQAMPVEGILGNLVLRDGSLFALAQLLRSQRTAVVIGYADVDVRPPPELDLCFVWPIDLAVLGQFLAVRFGRAPRSGEHARTTPGHSVPPAAPAAAPAGSRGAKQRR
jgi:hypothetical protein